MQFLSLPGNAFDMMRYLLLVYFRFFYDTFMPFLLEKLILSLNKQLRNWNLLSFFCGKVIILIKMNVNLFSLDWCFFHSL